VSTDLYGIRITEVVPADKRVRMTVFVVYYEASYESHQPIPEDRSFFVRVLCDMDALGDDISWDDRFDEAWIDANAFRYVDRFEEVERRNHPLPSWEGMADFYYERDGGWQDEERLVQADFDVFVTEERYLEALSVGESWGTTSYETNADGLTLADHPLLPDFSDARRVRAFPDDDQEEIAWLAFSGDGTKVLVLGWGGQTVAYRVEDLSAAEVGGDALDQDPEVYEEADFAVRDALAAAWTPRGAEVPPGSGHAWSPDRAFVALSSSQQVSIHRAATGERLRTHRVSTYMNGVAWSPDGTVMATSITDPEGRGGEVVLHRIARLVDEARSRPHAVPPERGGDLRDVVALYLARTGDFGRGWSSHLDDDRLDAHLALARLGLESTLVAEMASRETKAAARAWEAVIARERGDSSRAASALAHAQELVAEGDVDGWVATFVYAPLAAARHAVGADGEDALEKAHIELDDEANDFQKRAVLCRALLALGRADEVRRIALDEETSWIGDFHCRLLSDLIDRQEWDLLVEVWQAWNAEDEWDAVELVTARLAEVGAGEVAARLELEEPDESAPDDLSADPDSLEAVDRVGWFGAQGRWAEAYAVIDATKSTLRNPLWQRVVEVSRTRGDMHIVLDALAQLPCGDMNAPGLRALQATMRHVAGPAWREWHP